MKIAICLSGFMRTFIQTNKNFTKFLLSKYSADVFINTWDIQDAHIPHLKVNEEILQSIYNPKDIRINQFKKYVPFEHKRNPNPNRDTNNVFSMFQNIYDCNKLKTQYEILNNFEYDVVIRIRPDVSLNSEFKLIKNDSINIPKFGDFGGINDQVAYGNSKNMNIYSSLILKFEEYLIKDEMLVAPEILMKHHLIMNSLNINRFDLPYDLICHGLKLNNETRDSQLNFYEHLKSLGYQELIINNRILYRQIS